MNELDKILKMQLERHERQRVVVDSLGDNIADNLAIVMTIRENIADDLEMIGHLLRKVNHNVKEVKHGR